MDICEKFLCYVILHYGDENLTINCLKSLNENSKNVFVVVNGSGEKIENILTKEFPEIRKISLAKNNGFAGGMNRGIKEAIKEGYKWIMILNNDVECFEDFKTRTIEALRELGEKRIVFSPLIYDKDGKKIWFAEGKISKITGKARHIGYDKKNIFQEKKESGYLTGCAMCFPAKAAEEAGLMDESYFLYWEDVDWSLRLKEAGYKLFVCPELKIKHIGSASTLLESEIYLYYYFRNHLKFIFKNICCFVIPFAIFFYLINVARVFAAWALFHGKAGRKKISAVLSGIKDFILHREGEKIFN